MDTKKKRIVCFGDSNTYGYDPRSYFGGEYPEDVIWTNRIAKAGYEVINLGLNGRRIPASKNLTRSACESIKSYQPIDLLIVMLGTNDLLGGRTFQAENVAVRMEAFLDSVRNVLDDTRILLIAPPAMEPGEWVTEERLVTESKRLGGFYRKVADKIGADFADSALWGVGTAHDGIHFTEKGHGRFAEELEAKLKEMEF